MSPKRPINADVPAQAEPREGARADQEPLREPAPPAMARREPTAGREPKPRRVPKSRPEPKPQREPKPLTPKLLVALVVLALAFFVAAVLGGSGGSSKKSEAAAPVPAPTTGGSGGEAPSASAETLGYPSFATNNTTRIGGPDPATNAAAVALAVFPSTTPAQRPAAVTLVDEEDWAGAIAASVLMAAPLRAPLLFSAPDELPQASAEALASLDPQGARTSGGASLFAIGAVAPPSGAGKTTRVDSGDPASTAAQIATLRDRLFGGPPKHFLIAPSDDPEIAMPAAGWAARSGDPVLYASADELPQPTAAILKSHPKVPVYVLGAATAISAKVMDEIGAIDKRVKRVGGRDAVANAIAFARYGDGDFGWDVNDPGHGFVLARSDSPAEAAGAAALSASGTWGPLLLTDDAGTLPTEVRSYLLDVKPGYTTNPTRAFYNRVWVIGDQEAIDVNQQAEVNELAELAKIGGEE